MWRPVSAYMRAALCPLPHQNIGCYHDAPLDGGEDPAASGSGTASAWAKLRERNEALDCAVLARAALWLLGADRYGERFWQRLRDQINDPPLASPAPSHSQSHRHRYQRLILSLHADGWRHAAGGCEERVIRVSRARPVQHPQRQEPYRLGRPQRACEGKRCGRPHRHQATACRCA